MFGLTLVIRVLAACEVGVVAAAVEQQSKPACVTVSLRAFACDIMIVACFVPENANAEHPCPLAIDVTGVRIVAAVVGENPNTVQSRTLAKMFSFIRVVAATINEYADAEYASTLRKRPATIQIGRASCRERV